MPSRSPGLRWDHFGTLSLAAFLTTQPPSVMKYWESFPTIRRIQSSISMVSVSLASFFCDNDRFRVRPLLLADSSIAINKYQSIHYFDHINKVSHEIETWFLISAEKMKSNLPFSCSSETGIVSFSPDARDSDVWGCIILLSLAISLGEEVGVTDIACSEDTLLDALLGWLLPTELGIAGYCAPWAFLCSIWPRFPGPAI